MMALSVLRALVVFAFVVVAFWVVGEAGGPPWAQVMTGILVAGQMVGSSR